MCAQQDSTPIRSRFPSYFRCIIPGAAFTMPSGSFVVARTLFANKISLPQLLAA